MIKVVFLDRDTLAPGVYLPPLTVPHTWQNYGRTSAAEVVARCQDADAIITNKVAIDHTVINHLPKLKYIGVAATGVNVIDLAACRARSVTVTNVTQYGSDSVAEHTLLLMLMLARQMVPYQRALARGDWQVSGQFCFFLNPIASLKGLSLGLIGTGAIAQKVALLARGFGMEVRFHSPSGRKADIPYYPLAELLAISDLISLHCPLNEQTFHLIDSAELQQMKASAWLINCARGPIVNPRALLQALTTKAIAGAALDVLPEEPPAVGDPLLSASLELDNLLITPHIAWASSDAMQNLANQLSHKLNAFFLGLLVTNLAK